MNEELPPSEAIAIIGMSGRFPGAANPDEFWQNLLFGRDSITRFEDRVAPDGSKHIGARSLLDRPDLFDASFFGIYPKEAELMDPQHRIFLECAWEALEHAACDPSTYPGMIGVYAGLSLNTYLLHNLGKARDLAANYQVGEYQTMLGNDKDFLPVRVSYKLNLRGPSMTVQTACSTSLVAICQAATALLTYQCDMALAGGVSISFPQKRHYLYTEEGMVSGDGAVRAFDQNANGTVFGHGCGVVVLKRLSEALADRDPILAVIKGWAVNNDGSDKIGFAAPGLNTQADVIALAQAAAGVHPSGISYIEAHGTGTPLGDPIEVAALTKAFRQGGASENAYCALGTGKTHIGHLDVAAGVTGLIKTIQQLRHNKIPALLHFTAPNPRIDFANSPFQPVAETKDWPRTEKPRLAGVSAFGVGGTNAHVIVEEAPLPLPTTPGRKQHLLILSAKTATALDAMAADLAGALENQNLADVSYTLATGRQPFPYRRHIVAADIPEAISKLGQPSKPSPSNKTAPCIAFLFPGQGSQYPDMGRALYDSEPAYRAAVDECAAILQTHLHLDLRATLYPTDADRADGETRLHQTSLTQPCIFVSEYALAKLWLSWGAQPSLLIGHSIGEYVAAVLAGTFTLPDALSLLATRARLMQDLPSGAMLAVRQSAAELDLPPGIDLAAINSEKLCTLSGPHDAIATYQRQLEEKRIACRPLQTSHAFHSAMMDPIVASFTAAAAKILFTPPSIPWISTSTGREIDANTLADPGYWSRQLRHTVRFADALATAFATGEMILLEVGPGQALAPFARQHPARGASPIISTLPSSSDDLSDLLNAAGELWKSGVPLDWPAFFAGQQRNRLHLPTYPFERQSYWIDRSQEVESPELRVESSKNRPDASSHLPSAISHLPSSPAMSRLPDLSATLRSLILDLSGIAVEDDSATFTELGFDSLFLTQASQTIQSRFGVKITFRQMLGDLSSVAALAAHLDKELPVDAAPTAPAVVSQTPASAAVAPLPSSGSTIEHLLANQIQLLQALMANRPGSADPRVRTEALSPPAASHQLPPIHWPANHSRGTSTPTRFGPYKPLEKGENGGLTPAQQKALDDLISRYTRKTAASKAYTAEHRPHYADPRAVSGFKSLWKEMVYPIVSARSKGSKIWDLDGNDYIDITMGFGTYFFGHSPDWLVEALENQLKTGIEIGPQSPLAGKLAKAICDLTGQERVTFCNTGSEAVMAAMRLARTVTGRNRIAYFTGDYHGMFEEVLVRGAWIDGVYKPQPIAPGIPQSLVENILVLDYADPASLEILRAHAHQLAAIMVEPVQSRAPGLQPRDFMHAVRQIARDAGAALIFDEIVTGFRCHPGGAQAYFGVEADLCTYGKVIGGGMPIGVLAGKKEYMDALDGGAWNYGDDSFPEVGMTFFAGTFVRHPLALAAASRVVEYLQAEGPRLQIELSERVERFCRTLNDHFAAIGVPIRLPHFSAYAVIEHAPDLKHASLLWYYLREKGIHIWEGRPLYFTTAHTDEDFDRIFLAFTEAVAEMQAAGFLPQSATQPQQGRGRPARIPSFPRHDTVPTTEAQREIFHSLMMGDDANCAYNESNIIRLHGPLDPAALKTALADIVARHPALRSNFSHDGFLQYFHPAPPAVEIMEHDYSSVDPASPAALLPLRLIRETESGTPFDLTRGPLIRFHLIKLPDQHHELLFTAHHIICDGWSFGMLLMELAHAYNARKSQRLPLLPPAMSFADYARLEIANKNSPDTAKAETYWLSKFQNGAPVLELPTDHPRPQVKTYSGAMETLVLDDALYTRLKQSSPKLGGTLFATLLSAFATLLHRLTGQDDLVIGVPAAGQTRIGRDELVGHCLNFLPLRLRPAADRPFRVFAAEVKEQVLEAYDHQACTFGALLKKLSLPRDTSRLPLVNVMFNIDKTGTDQIRFDDLQLDVQTNPKRHVNFELFFNLVQTDNRLVVECEYNPGLHHPSTIRSWLAAYQRLIESAIESFDRPLKQLDIVSPSDRRKLLHDWNATATAIPGAPSLHHLIETQAHATPDAFALHTRDRSLTYRDLDRHANALARRLRDAGITRETLVGICATRRAELLVAILATLKAGGAYVPIDPKYPRERIAYILRDAKSPILLTEQSLLPDLPADTSTRRILIDDALHHSDAPLPPLNQPSDLAYIIYTSGSTGQPKGVAIEHHSAIALIGWARTVYTREETAGVLFSTSICFDLSVFEIFFTLSTGGALILAENALDLSQHPHAGKITLINTVPSAISELLAADLIPASTQVINLAGEPLSTTLVDHLHASTPVRKIYDLYGPSEDTTYSTCALRRPGQPATIGRPISNTQAYILDADARLLPLGVPGELYLGGAGLARGYLHRPELTAEKFIPTPFSPAPSDRLYRTGDRARWLPDGTLQFLGRLDHQVKLRGHRIELGEIETLLEQHPSVGKAIATVQDGKLAAYLTLAAPIPSGDGTAIWQDQWDLLYQSAIDQSGSGKLDRLDSVIAGWSGLGNIDAQVAEWIDATSARLRHYHPRRILEIGCGTGQILSRLAPDAEVYWAADISKVAIEALQKNHPLPQVKLLHRPADDFSGIPENYFDTVIINSVAQYFPDAAYLARVLQNATRTLKPGGRIFLGDVQSHALLPAHHAEALRERAPAGATCGQLRDKIAQRLSRETELSLDPAWFERLDGFSHIEIQLRRGKLANETTTYHYDVILHTGEKPSLLEIPHWRDWQRLNLEQLEAILAERPDTLAFRGIPDARLSSPLGFLRVLQEAPADCPLPFLPAPASSAVTAEDLHSAAENAGYRAHVRWSGDGSSGLLDAVFIPLANPQLPHWPRYEDSDLPLANTPAHEPASAHRDLSAALRAHLSARLPDYMIPAAFITLDAFPLTPNGKIDRKALPDPSQALNSQSSTPNSPRTAPRNEPEEKLVAIWQQVLGIDPIGIDDDIFELGGDSILIFQIGTRATRAGLPLAPADIFRHRTIAKIAAALSNTPTPAPATAIQRVNRDAYRRQI